MGRPMQNDNYKQSNKIPPVSRHAVTAVQPQQHDVAGSGFKLLLPVPVLLLALLWFVPKAGSTENPAPTTAAGIPAQGLNALKGQGWLRLATSIPLDWQVRDAEGKLVLEQADSRYLSHAMPTGEYDVLVTGPTLSHRQRVVVKEASTQALKLMIPYSQVKLMATLNNAPAMRPARWTLYRLERGQRQAVPVPQRHVAMIVLPAGTYEAVVQMDGRERRRSFMVQNGDNNEVMIAMD